MAGTPSPPSEAALARFFAEASGARAVQITGIELLAGGAIQQNWGFEAEFLGGALAGRHALVLRTDADTGIPSSLGRTKEFAVLKAAHAAGVTVPEPLFVCADARVIGKPFFVMRRLPGTAQGRLITTDPALEAALPEIAARLGAELARTQTIRPPRADLAFLPRPEESGPAAQLAGFRAYLDRHPQPRPVLECGLRWLETHIPAPLPPVLCHRDFRTGNYLLDGPELTGILDWEFAGWGDPDEDIGWFCCKGWRFARLDRAAGGIADRAAFYRGYEAASGRRVDPDRVFFWEVFANLRWAVIALQQSDRHLIGGARDLSTAIIGRRAGECELELLMLLDPAGAPGEKTPSPPPGERVGVREQLPSPGSPSGLAPLSRTAGEGLLGDRPSGLDLLELGHELLLDELLPLVPEARHRELHLLATAIAIARREARAGEAPGRETLTRLAEFYRCAASQALLPRFAADLRNGAFETSGPRERDARAILWAMTIARLRASNPQFLAANGFGE
jgi:aminoglycoside phosphotransferase (APT) family kinase protein